MIFIPSRTTKRIRQSNRSNLLGDLWSTWNIDLQSNVGAFRVSSKMRLNASTANDADFGLPCAFANFDGLMWTIAGTRIFKNNASTIINGLTTEDVSSNARTDYTAVHSDLKVFNGKLWATSSLKLQSKESDGSGTGAWTNRRDLTSGSQHRLCYFKKRDRLYFSDGDAQIYSIDTSNSVATSGDYYINLGTSVGNIRCMDATSDYIYIGMIRQVTDSDGNNTEFASILIWDGRSAQITREIKTRAQAILSIKAENDIFYCIDSNGILYKGIGTTVTEIDRLPLNKEMLLDAVTATNEPFIHPNGMIITKDGTIQVLVRGAIGDNDSSSLNQKENLPSGIWEWSETNGFYHRYSMSYTPVFVSGTETTDTTDFGQIRLFDVGALSNANIYSLSSSGRSTIICGATYYTDATTTTHGCFVDSPIPTNITATSEGKKFGNFVTSWITSSGIKDTWLKVVAFYKQFGNSTDKIIIKYRTTESNPIEITGTWASATSFNTTTDVSSYIGYEVEVLNGTGAGKCAHITNVSYSNPNYSVTLDESFVGTTSGTAKMRIQNWKKASYVSDQITESGYFKIDTTSERIQLKCAMQFTGDGELREIALVNKTHTPLL